MKRVWISSPRIGLVSTLSADARRLQAETIRIAIRTSPKKIRLAKPRT